MALGTFQHAIGGQRMPKNNWARAIVKSLLGVKQVTLDVEREQYTLRGQPNTTFTRFKIPAVVTENVLTKTTRGKFFRNARITIPVTDHERLKPSDTVTLPNGYRMTVDSVEYINPSGDDVYYEVMLSG